MAKQTVCDRCGALIPAPPKDKHDVDWSKYSDSYFMYVGTTRSITGTTCFGHPKYEYNYFGRNFDLCEDCRDSLHTWFTLVDFK